MKKANDKVTLFKSHSKESKHEEPLVALWNQNKKWFYLLVILVIIGLGAYQGIRSFKASRLNKIQSAFLEIENDEQRLDFAKQYKSHPLGALAYLTLADDAYKAEKFDDASDYYEDAQKGFCGTIFEQRAILGEAVSEIRKGDKDDGKEILRDLIGKKDIAPAIAAEALFTLAMIEFDGKDYSDCKMHLETIQKLPNPGIFGEKAKLLDEQLQEKIKK